LRVTVPRGQNQKQNQSLNLNQSRATMPNPSHTLQVELRGAVEDRSYPIVIGRGLLADLQAFAPGLDDVPVVLVTNETVAPLYLPRVRAALGAERKVTEIILPDGEDQKNLTTANTIWQRALEDRHERRSLFMALGGGVVGDLTGFAAACFLRGARFIQLPTTLLAQVDSSVGGKTGVNHAMGKNLIGAFHQPDAVLIDLDTLESLPDREFAAGMAEVVKYGCICSPQFFDWLMEHTEALRGRDGAVVAEAIARSCAIKAEVVAKDEREGGLRAILNYGHTFGHAIEQVMGYGNWLHGEAVACGMVIATRISASRGLVPDALVERLADFLRAFSLPVAPPSGMSAQAFLDAMALDKKVVEGRIRYVLLDPLGRATVVNDVSSEEIARAIA